MKLNSIDALQTKRPTGHSTDMTPVLRYGGPSWQRSWERGSHGPFLVYGPYAITAGGIDIKCAARTADDLRSCAEREYVLLGEEWSIESGPGFVYAMKEIGWKGTLTLEKALDIIGQQLDETGAMKFPEVYPSTPAAISRLKLLCAMFRTYGWDMLSLWENRPMDALEQAFISACLKRNRGQKTALCPDVIRTDCFGFESAEPEFADMLHLVLSRRG